MSSVRVNMGTPLFSADAVPVTGCKYRMQVVQEPIKAAGRLFKMTCVSMGNPHTVVFVEDVQRFPVDQTGPCFECHPRFPRRTNVEFVQVLDRATIYMRVWERGSGETCACGTGACAAVAACVLNGLTDAAVTVKLLGGQLKIEWDLKRNLLFMQGPAETVFEGEYRYPQV